jgi:hypothetical protein
MHGPIEEITMLCSLHDWINITLVIGPVAEDEG